MSENYSILTVRIRIALENVRLDSVSEFSFGESSPRVTSSHREIEKKKEIKVKKSIYNCGKHFPMKILRVKRQMKREIELFCAEKLIING